MEAAGGSDFSAVPVAGNGSRLGIYFNTSLSLSLSLVSLTLSWFSPLFPWPPRALFPSVPFCPPAPSAPVPRSPPQVKVWFQNRRTKQKKDQSRDSEKRSTATSESFATCNILRLLEQGRLLSVLAPPSLLSPTSNPIGSPTGNGSSLATPGTTSPGLGGRSSPPGPGAFSLQVPSLASSSSSSSSPRLPATPLCFGGPLLGSLHDLPGAYGLGTSAFEPYTRLERKDNSIPSKKPSP